MGWFSRLTSGMSMPAADASAAPAGGDAVLLDVRSPGEFASGHIDGAVNVPLNRLAHDIAGAVPDRATPLVLYCQSGGRSGMACQVLRQLGYTQLSNGGGVGALALQLGRPIRRLR
jgi:phage shock protein E